MDCPVCNSHMVEEDFGGVEVDICRHGCKGIWFDWGELAKLHKDDMGCAKAMEEALNAPRNNDDNRGQIKCPRCGIPMRIHQYKHSKEVTIDECYSCGGFFLDSGELQTIRRTHMCDEERKAYADRLAGEIPGFEVVKERTARNPQIMNVRSRAIMRFVNFF